MKPPLLILSIVAGVLGGMLVGPRLGTDRDDDDDRVLPAIDEQVRAEEVRSIAAEECRARLAARPADPADEAEDADLVAALESFDDELEHLVDILDRTAATTDTAARVVAEGGSRGERAVRLATLAMMRDPLALGRALLTSRVPAVRRLGIRQLERAARRGDAEAFLLLSGAMSDADLAVAGEARQRAVSLLRRDDPEMTAQIRASGIEAQLVAWFPRAQGSERRRLLQALTALDNAAALPAWREEFDKARPASRSRIRAAQSLAKLGSPTEMRQLLADYRDLLASPKARDVKRAISDLRRLGGDEAREMLQRALDADPEGPYSKRIESALRRMAARKR